MTDNFAGDNGGHFPDFESARAYLDGTKESNTSAAYHADRMRALQILVDSVILNGKIKVLDFGCGDGMYIKQFFQEDAIEKVIGVDVSGPMIEIAKQSLEDYEFEGIVGDARCLKNISGEFDVAFAIDVLGYLDDEELDIFYREAMRLIRPGGHLIVMYGNELFDMYALNSGTATFFEKYFDADVKGLLLEGGAAQYKPANRRNPLSFGAEIAKYGFEEQKQSFSQWHRIPPAIGNRAVDLSEARMNMRDHGFDANRLSSENLWKAKFRCSIFASLSRRTG
jgi:SAM-dependent methyltransferase